MTKQIKVGNVLVGGGAPVSIQSMTNTRTDDVSATAEQIKRLAAAGCEIVRVAVPDMAAARAVGKIKFQKDIRRYKVNSLSIGYELAREHWGHGYMTEALRAMIQCGFERKKIDVLAIGHFSGNNRSRRVIEKCGFQYEGVIRRAFGRCDGQVFDDVCYSILREEYFAHPERYLGTQP